MATEGLFMIKNKLHTPKEVYEILTSVENETFVGTVREISPYKPKANEVFIVRCPNEQFFKTKTYKTDGYGFLHLRSSTNSNKNTVTRSYYTYKMDKQSDYTSGFNLNVSYLVEPINSERRAVLLHYMGDETIYTERPHLNAKCKTSNFTRRNPSVSIEIDRVFSENRGLKPREVNNIVTQSTTKKVAGLIPGRQRMGTPRDTVQCKNIIARKRREQKILNDEIFSLWEVSKTNLKDVIWTINIQPSVVIHCADPRMINLAKILLTLQSKTNYRNLNQFFGYDTTFNIGDFYMSTLVMRNTLIQGDKVFPIFAMFHNKRRTVEHEGFWRFIKSQIGPEIERLTDIMPIIIDREQASINAINSTFPNLQKIYCFRHIVTDVSIWLKKHQKDLDKDSREEVENDIKKIMKSITADEIETKVIKFSEKWPTGFLDYFNANLRNDIIEYGNQGIAQKYGAFKDPNLTFTNNISESYNSAFKRRFKPKNLLIDVAVFSFYYYQIELLHYYSEANKLGDSEYQLKEEFKETINELIPNDIMEGGMDYIPYDDIIASIKSSVPYTQSVVEKTEFYRALQAFLAEEIISHGTCEWSENAFNVKGKDELNPYYVTIPEGTKDLICNCPDTGLCKHIIAVFKKIGYSSENDKHSYNMLQFESNLKPPRAKTGRKGAPPREKRPRTVARQSTPRKAKKARLQEDADTSIVRGMEIDDQDDVPIILENIPGTSGQQPQQLENSPIRSPINSDMVEQDMDEDDTIPEPGNKTIRRISFESTSGSEGEGEKGEVSSEEEPFVKSGSEIYFKNYIDALYNENDYDNFQEIPDCVTPKIQLKTFLRNLEKLDDTNTLKTLAFNTELDIEVLHSMINRLLVSENEETFVLNIPNYISNNEEENRNKLEELIRWFDLYSARNRSILIIVLYSDLAKGKETSGHYSLGLICFPSKRIYILDSGNHIPDKSTYQHFKWLSIYARACNLIAYADQDKFNNWRWVWCTDVPKQNDSVNCGLYVIYNVASIIKRVPYSICTNNDNGRIWVFTSLYRLLTYPYHKNTSPSKTISKSYLQSNRNIKEYLKTLLNWKIEVVDYLIDKVDTKDIMQHLIATETDQGDFSFCGLKCDGGVCSTINIRDNEQHRCVKCFKWYHVKCYTHRKIGHMNGPYFTCC
jgi:Ulp1 protease family, C-terminal catalytic domain/MULE transposase domain